MSSLNWTYICLLGLLPAACSLGDFDSLGAGPPLDNIGGSAGTSGSGGSAGRGGSGGTGGTGVTGGTGGSAGTGGTGGTAGAAVNLIANPGFEGATSWACIGNCVAQIVQDDNPHSGSRCLLTTNRTELWEGPSFNIRGRVEPGATYMLSVWIRSQPSADAGAPESYPVKLTHKKRCTSIDPADGAYITILEGGEVTSEWGELSTTFSAETCPDLAESIVYVDNAPIGAEYCIDDTSLTLVP